MPTHRPLPQSQELLEHEQKSDLLGRARERAAKKIASEHRIAHEDALRLADLADQIAQLLERGEPDFLEEDRRAEHARLLELFARALSAAKERERRRREV